MKQSRVKKFLLLSDIHATDVDPASSGAPSYVSSFSASATGKHDPLSELQRLVQSESLSPDYILCAGDITNRSNPGSLTYAWARLNSLATACGAKLITTVGNHDIDSRYQANRFDPRGYAMALAPRIPVEVRERFLEFWAENFTLISDDGCNVLVVNTAAYHGGGKEAGVELEHGRISEITLASMRGVLENAPSAPVNVLLCHHHPIKGDQGDLDLVGQTRGGEKLIELLGEASNAWVVVHGHKHVPDLFYGHGGGNAPVILGCASFSAQVNADAQNKNPNQVHLLTCDPDAAQSAGLNSAGEVRSWTWQPGVGWQKSQGRMGLPSITGFGYRGSAKVLAERVDTFLTNSGRNQATWINARAAIPELGFLVPSDFAALDKALIERKLALLSDREGDLAQVGRSE